ncbi:hypothetical protein [Micromonospora sp. DT233]|uniref:hypothetical protein n=1 Tax=Micromonospora sp. DT233 TaxID=3393432 RepID=UPI003CF768EF
MGNSSPDEERGALVAGGRRRDGWLIAGVLLVVAVVAVLAVLAGEVLGGDGWLAGKRPWLAFLIMLVPPLLGAVVALTVGRRLLRRMPPAAADPETMRRVKRALRDGSTDDPRVDALARDQATRILARRWMPWVSVLLLAAQLAFFFLGSGDAVQKTVAGVGVVCWAGLIVAFLRSRRRARRYLAA